MGNYASTTELQTRFENTAELEFLTDKAEGAGIDTGKLTDAIETAEGEIDSALSKRYATPVDVSVDTTLAALLNRKTLEAAEVYMLRKAEGSPDVKQDQLQEVLDWLDKLVEGKRNLVGAVTVASTASADPRADWTDSGRELPDTSARIFTRPTTSRL